MSVIIRIEYMGGHVIVSDEHAGTYVKYFNPDGHGGHGNVVVTKDRNHALKFQDAAEALACWKQQSRTHPLRDDGLPNRPLTAFTVSIENL